MNPTKQYLRKPPASAARNPENRRIIGLDPGLAFSGWGVVEWDRRILRHVAHGCIETSPDIPHAERLLVIYRRFRAVLEGYAPDESAMETLYFARNVTSALMVAEARGVIAMTLAQQGLSVREFSPKVIKQAVVGRGEADKAQVQEMVRVILGLPAVPAPDHAADALGAAVCCAHTACWDRA
ncbi:MAG: crossover junction endodeoxyribonuclease RuvC [Spirochaetaceae bacterium]|nr:crossover junction endodeoxyribonuclease RuvC [Spirochaetaceae bacterium]